MPPWKRPETDSSDDDSTQSSGARTGASSPSARTSGMRPASPSGTVVAKTSKSRKPISATKRLSKSGALVPLERASGSSRLPALDFKAARRNEIARRFKAVVSGKRPRPAPPSESAFGSPSKYAKDDEDEGG